MTIELNLILFISFRFGVNHLDVAPNYAAILMGISNTGNLFIFVVSFKSHMDFDKSFIGDYFRLG